MNDQAIEQEVQANGLTAPRVTPQDIEDNIESEWYFTAGQGVLEAFKPRAGRAAISSQLFRLSFCVLVLRNGFTVTGESACVSPENFDQELGWKVARQNAIAKVWPLMGYELKERLYQRAAPAQATD